jgi:hypothetical protein
MGAKRSSAPRTQNVRYPPNYDAPRFGTNWRYRPICDLRWRIANDRLGRKPVAAPGRTQGLLTHQRDVAKSPTHRVGNRWHTGQEGLKVRVERRPVDFGEPQDRLRIEIGAQIDRWMIAAYDPNGR